MTPECLISAYISLQMEAVLIYYYNNFFLNSDLDRLKLLKKDNNDLQSTKVSVIHLFLLHCSQTLCFHRFHWSDLLILYCTNIYNDHFISVF